MTFVKVIVVVTKRLKQTKVENIYFCILVCGFNLFSKLFLNRLFEMFTFLTMNTNIDIYY